MAVSVRVTSTGKDISVLLNEALSPQAQSQALASFARAELEKAEDQNQRVLGRVPEHDTFVDGRENAPLESVRPRGVIVFEFHLVSELLVWIYDQLVKYSPKRSGAYSLSHKLFADGAEVDPHSAPQAEVYEFLSIQPYARKIERGLSAQAPDGVYQVVAEMAQRRFGNQARISFTYVAPIDGPAGPSSRQPAIVINPR